MNKRYQRGLLIVTGILLSVLLFLTSCNPDDSPEAPNVPTLRSLSADEQVVVRSSNDFAFHIMSIINADHSDENVFISPFSISTALSMTLNGAGEETLTAMKETLELQDLSNEEINTAYRDLVDFLLGLDNTVALEIANSNWYRDNMTINPAFERILSDYYDAEVKATDFTDPQTLDQINGWIEDKTHGKIKDMLDEVPPGILMYLINAVYFKAEWKYRFDPDETSERPFYLSDGSSIEVPTMVSEGVTVSYASAGGLQLIDIPYGNGQYLFTIILPEDHQANDINEVVGSFTGEALTSLLADTSTITVKLFLPKFTLAFKKLLNDPLIAMGMGVAFSDQADFSHLFTDGSPAQINRVIHQSFLEVNEEGSEAAAATIVEIIETSAGPPALIQIDHPFMFFIREKHSGTILFSGKMVNPTL